MRMRWVVTSVAVLAVGLSVQAAPQATVVDAGRSGTIIVPPRPGLHTDTLTGALDLSRTIGKMTGRSLPVVVEGQSVYVLQNGRWRELKGRARPTLAPPPVEIHVGWTSAAKQVIDAQRISKLDQDGFLIKVASAQRIFLIGPTPWANGYACCQFLEQHCGVRWYIPGEIGEDVPRRAALSVPVGEKVYEPAYGHRQYSGFQWHDAGELRAWKRHSRMRPRLYYHHNLWRVFDVTKWSKKYPGLYPILHGKHRIPGPGVNAGWQPNLAHPKAVEITLEYAKEFFAKQPDAASISIAVNDGGGYPENPETLALVDKDAEPNAQYSRWFFTYANKVGEAFDKRFPNKFIGYLLYGKTKVFPEGMKIHPRLIGFYVTPSYALIDQEGLDRFHEALTGLTPHVKFFALYDWFYGDGLCIPRLQVRQAQHYLKYGYEKGARHVKAEAYMNWGLDGFKYRLYADLAWNPFLDVDKWLDEFYTRFFKEAARPMRQYFDVVEKYSVAPVYVERANNQGEMVKRAVNFWFRKPEQFLAFPPKAVEECEGFLAAAEKRARQGIVRRRVRYFRQAFQVSKMMTQAYHYARQAIPLFEKTETLSQGFGLLAKAMSPDLDVARYYKWAIPNDAFQVRYPPTTAFGLVTQARSAAAGTLGRAVIDEIRTKGFPVTAARVAEAQRTVLDRAVGRIRDADAADVVRTKIGPFAGKVVLCNKGPAPNIDGELDDPCWQRAQVFHRFNVLGTGAPAKYLTEFMLAHDGTRLYVAARCYQDTGKILTHTSERDGRVWREDSIEVVVNKPAPKDSDDYFQVIANSRGNLFDIYQGDANWDGDIPVGNKVKDTHYTVELSVPFAQIAIDPKKDRLLRLNFVRNVYEMTRARTGRHTELSTWFLTHAGNRDMASRGWLVVN